VGGELAGAGEGKNPSEEKARVLDGGDLVLSCCGGGDAGDIPAIRG